MSESSVDISQFQADLRQYLLLTSKSISEALNHVMKDILIAWYMGIPVADRGKILADLRRITFRPSMRRSKNGIKWVKQKRGTPLVYKIINKRRQVNGVQVVRGLTGQDMEDAAQSMINARLRSVGALRSGLIGALREYGGNNGLKFAPVKSKGYARRAVDSFDAEARAFYVMNTYERKPNSAKSGKALEIDPRVEDACGRAFLLKGADIKVYLDRKFAENAKKTGFAPT